MGFWAMHILGIDFRQPSFGELTAAAVMACGCWLAATGIANVSGHPLSSRDAGALLAVIGWGAVSARLGVRLDKGGRHAIAHVTVSALLLGCYEAAMAAAMA